MSNMGARAKLSEKAYANAWNQFTQEKAKKLINENIKKRGGLKYHSACPLNTTDASQE